MFTPQPHFQDFLGHESRDSKRKVEELKLF